MIGARAIKQRWDAVGSKLDERARRRWGGSVAPETSLRRRLREWTAAVEIRTERPGDAEAIRRVTRAAFKHEPHSDRREADIIDALRAARALTVSLVAVQDDEIVGHVACSLVEIAAAQGDWYGLGPVSVRPDRQRNGIGQALIWLALKHLASLNAAGCVVLGDPRYYRRFGFESDPTLTYGSEPSPYFQRRILGGPLASGQVRYHRAFDV